LLPSALFLQKTKSSYRLNCWYCFLILSNRFENWQLSLFGFLRYVCFFTALRALMHLPSFFFRLLLSKFLPLLFISS
jgi:hypothetical protein